MPTTINRLPVSISASVINPSTCSPFLTGINPNTTPNITGAVPNTQIGILVRDMAHANATYAPPGLGNMNSENNFRTKH